MLQFLSNNLNPIFVKEIRQFTRSNFIAVLVNLYIFLLLFLFLHFLSAFSNSNNNISTVRFFWWVFCYIVLGTCFFSVIVRTVWSTSVERNNDDLMFYSSIKSSTIVVGKLLTGFVTTFVLMSVTMPFVVLLNLMGGNDLRYMAFVLVAIFIIVQVMNALAILIASIFKMPFAHFISLFIVLVVLCIAYLLITEIIAVPFGLFTFVELFIFQIILFTLFVCVAIANFSPKKANRSFFMRLVATVICVIMTCISIFFISSPLYYWLSYVVSSSFFILMFFLAIVVCENDQWTPRIRQSLPKSLFRRVIMFPFCTGSACGLVWIILMTAILALVDLSIIFPPLSFGSSLFGSFIHGDKCWKIVLLFILVFDICVTAMLIRSWFLKQINTSRVWLIAILVLSFVVFGSIIVAGIYFAFHGINVIDFPTWWIKYKNSDISSINPIMLFLDSIANYGYDDFFMIILSPIMLIPEVIDELMNGEVLFSRCYVAICWAIILLPFLFVWYLQRLKNFSPYNIEEPFSYEDAQEAVKNSTVVE